jgi:gamma-glutamyl hercynylcysteine S-oxide synthase
MLQVKTGLISRAVGLALALCLVVGTALSSEQEPIADNPLILVPGGSFIFGRDEANANERPRRELASPPFEMNETQITNAQYESFVQATGHRPPYYAGHPVLGLADHPVVGVNWYDARDFCAHYALTLPSEREFERAARGRNGAPYPWGDAPAGPSQIGRHTDNCCAGDDSDVHPMTAPVKAFTAGQSPDGVFGLIGNVWQWTRDWYAPYEGEPDPKIAHRFKVLRGGAWNSDSVHLSATYRLAYDPNFRYAANGGFRCVRSPESPPSAPD